MEDKMLVPVERREAGLQPVEVAYASEIPQRGAGGGMNVLMVLARKWHIVVLSAALVICIGLPIIWLGIRPTYTATSAIDITPVVDRIVFMEDSGTIPFYSTYVNTQAKLIKGPRVLYPVLEDPVVQKLEYVRKLKDPLATIQKSVEAVADRNSQLVYVSVTCGEAQAAAEIANATVRAYMKIEGGSEATSEDEKLRTLEVERDTTSEKLAKLYDDAYKLGEEFGATDLTAWQSIMLAQIQTLQQELTNAQTQRLDAERQLAAAETQPDTDAALIAVQRTASVNADEEVKQLTAAISAKQMEQANEKLRRVGGSTALVETEQQIEALKNQLGEAKKRAGEDFDKMAADLSAASKAKRVEDLKQKLAQAQGHEKLVRDQLDKQNADVIALGRKGLTLKKLQDDIELTRNYYQRLTDRIKELEVERKRPARIRVAYEAQVPRETTNDKRMKFSIVLAMGSVLFGCAFAVFLNEIDPRVETPTDLETRCGLKVLGTTPRFKDLDKARVKPKHFVDDCRTIRVNLMLAAGGNRTKTLVIASPQGRDGKTTLAINLATSIALSGQRVLLMDGDFRKPEVARYLKLNNAKGLPNVLMGECRLADAIQQTLLPTLSILPANRSGQQQSELLARSGLMELLAELKSLYDEVIIDTPAVLAMPDAKLWAAVADAVMLVARSGKTGAKDLGEGKVRLQQAGARILGAVLTGVRVGDSYEKYQHRYGEGYVDEPLSEDEWSATKVFLLSRGGENGSRGAETDNRGAGVGDSAHK